MTENSSLFYLIRSDANRFLKDLSGFARLKMWVILVFFVPGFQLALSLRIQRYVVKIPFIGKAVRRVVWYLSSVLTSSEINVGADFGEGIYIPHPTGIVIRSECVIGKNITILQGVTIGRGDQDERSETIIGDNVKIYAGAVIIGEICIGNNVIIGANAVVLQSVPDGAMAVGVPARIILKGTHK